MDSGNGHRSFRPEVFVEPAGIGSFPPPAPPRRRTRSTIIAGVLFVLTVFSTLAVGAQFTAAYRANHPPFSTGDLDPYAGIFAHPGLLLTGLPFAFTLMGILLAHELGHFFACRYYGIAASYPYFIPAPTLIGTLGAFISIRSPIINRKALFDIGLAGPVVGFAFALPALAAAILTSKIVSAGPVQPVIAFGSPPLEKLLMAILRPGVRAEDLLLSPVGWAAWVGLFATALNLLPAGQLDGGHIVYALASASHRRLSLAVAIALVPLAWFWSGWLLWAVLLLAIGFRHPPLVDRWDPIDGKRRLWAVIGLVIFLLCFTPTPFAIHGG
ncbi:MAG TPA: site-2 protease family protein [Candidatus Acidoferrales bacterium]|nr:site-2 protease family protein [Candidatus Acidoferrales bacterium]